MKTTALRRAALTTLLAALSLAPVILRGQEDDEKTNEAELAKKLQNPIANLISVPIQNNWDWNSHSLMKYTANIQPVIPFSISKDWNLITRTIMPVIYSEPAGDKTGLGDIVQSFFLSPKAPVGGWIMGGGPVFLYPSATDDALGGEKWGAGPTAVVLQQKNGWTYGALANHLWSFTGNDERAYVSTTFLQPFVSYTTKKFTTYGINTESSYDWNQERWTVPINLSVSQLIKLGKQPISIQFGPRVYVERPGGGPNWGLRFAVTMLFPK